MRINYPILLSFVTLAAFTSSCVDKDYDMKKLQDVNTDMSFGGEYFGIPIGTVKPVKLGEFMKPNDMLAIVDGKYEFNYKNSNNTEIPSIDPISFDVDMPTLAPVTVDFGSVSISDIKLKNITVSKAKGKTFGESVPGIVLNPTTIALKSDPASDDKPIEFKIGYTYTDEIKYINWIEFGKDSGGKGDLLEVNLDATYADVLTAATIKIEAFELTLPEGFELAANPNDAYHGTITNKRTYKVAAQSMIDGAKMSFYAKKVTFNPSVDQTVKGNLDFVGYINYDAKFSIGGTSTGTVGEISMKFGVDKKLTMEKGDFDTNPISAQAPSVETSLNIDQALGTNMVKDLDEVTLAEKVAIDITISEEGLPAKLGKINFKDYKIDFPKFLVFEDEQINKDKSLSLNGESIIRGKVFTKRIYVTGFLFDQNPVTDGRLKIEGKVKTVGGFEVPAANNLSSDDVKPVVIKPNVVMGKMNVGKIKGIVQPDVNIDPQVIKIELSKDMDFLKEAVLDLERIALKLAVNNETEVSTEIAVKLTPYDDKGNVITENILDQKTGLEIAPMAVSKIWLSNSKVGMPEGFSFVENASMNKIMRQLPSKVVAEIAIVPSQKVSEVDLKNAQPMKLNLEYEVVAPLAVGNDFKIVYKEEVKGLGKDLKDYLGYIDVLNLEIGAKNEIPLDLGVTAEVFDAEGNPINVSVEMVGMIKAGNANGTPSQSSVKLMIKENVKGELQKLDKVKFTLIGNAGQDGGQLAESQLINLSLKAFIPGGIKINPNDI